MCRDVFFLTAAATGIVDIPQETDECLYDERQRGFFGPALISTTSTEIYRRAVVLAMRLVNLVADAPTLMAQKAGQVRH